MKKILSILLLSLSVFTMTAQTFSHSNGSTYIGSNGMQACHEYTNIIYANSGETLRLYRQSYTTFNAYARWYDYSNDQAANDITLITGYNYNYLTLDGMFSKSSVDQNEVNITFNGTRRQIACDQSGYTNYTFNSTSIVEPTLSQRMIYDIRPASEIAAKIDNCTGSTYLEEHNIIAPTGNILYIGPDYAFLNENVSGASTSYTTHCNYYYNASSPVQMTTSTTGTTQYGTNTITTEYLDAYGNTLDGKPTANSSYSSSHGTYYIQRTLTIKHYKSSGSSWIWSIDGVASTMTEVTGQFIRVNSDNVDTVIYTLQYSAGGTVYYDMYEYTNIKKYTLQTKSGGQGGGPGGGPGGQGGQTSYSWSNGQSQSSFSERKDISSSGTGTTYNIAKFTVAYYEKTKIGPYSKLTTDFSDMTYIGGNDFNYDDSISSSKTYYTGHLSYDESSYGYYYDSLKSYHTTGSEPYWSEYAIVNRFNTWSTNKTVYQHNDSLSGSTAAEKGYMIYCDGSEKPGDVFKLEVKADLCPGSTMYFSAWVADISDTGAAPNLDFIVIGVDELSKETVLTTYTTGEFGGNADDNYGEWMHICFPMKFDNVDYTSYRLKITNKGASGSGNDFAIDDIAIYMQKPPVTPIQASTYDCPSSDTTNITTYLRVDYQAIDQTSSTFYYQWRDYRNGIMTSDYIGGRTDYGTVTIPSSNADILASGDTCSSLLAFDTRYHNTDSAVIKYIKEQVDAVGTQRYVMYIAEPLLLRTNYTYTGYVSNRLEDLGSKEGCGTYADLLIAGGTRITINDDNVTEDTVSDICGNRSYNLGIVMTFVVQDETTGALKQQTTTCRADWLYGDSIYVNNHYDQFRGTFSEIENALVADRADSATTEQKNLVSYLLSAGLLQRNSATLDVQPIFIGGNAVTYTAFPIAGSAENGMQLCTAPRFLSIEPQELQSNFVVIGHEDEVLPTYVSMNPRKIRVSEQKLKDGQFGANMYLAGDSTKKYVVDKVVIVNSTYSGWETKYADFELSAKVYNRVDNTYLDTISNAYDSIVFFGTDLSTLVPGYDYTLYLHMKNSTTDCSMGYTYCVVRVVPNMVTWKAGSTAWNDDNSWEPFAPLPETNVKLERGEYIIPLKVDELDSTQMILVEDNAQYYITFDFNYVPFECNNIYLPEGATLIHQERLTINGQAYFDIKPTANQWQMRAFPIEGVVTGDIFSYANDTATAFMLQPINQTVGLDAYDRMNYPYYFSRYNSTSSNVDGATYTSSTWVNATNKLDYSINPGSGIMIGLDYDGADQPMLRFPKPDTLYRYYRSGAWVSDYETEINRDENYGKPAYSENMNITLTGNAASNIFLFGNPTFSPIDITKLIEANSDILTGAYYYSGNGVSNRYEHITCINDISADGENHTVLYPYQAVLLQAKESSTSITLTIPSSIMVQSNGKAALRRKNNEANRIYLSASYSDYISNAVIEESENNNDDYTNGEDVELLLMPKAQTPFGIYTMSNDKALSINRINSKDFIYIGCIFTKNISNVVLELTGNDNYLAEWDLLNLVTNETTPLYDGMIIEDLANVEYQYALIHSRKNIIATDIHTNIIEDNNNAIYDITGKYIGTTINNLQRGIYIVKTGNTIKKIIIR